MRHAIARVVLASGLTLGAFMGLAGGPASGGESAFGVIADTPHSFELLLQLGHGLDHVDGLRVLPIAGKGPVQTLTDLVNLDGIDAALVTSDALGYARANALAPGIEKKVSVLVKLAGLDVHIVAKGSINSFSDLEGKVIAVGGPSSSSFIAAHLLTATTGVSARALAAEGIDAVAAVIKGKADAAILVGRKPLPELASAKGLHLVNVGLPSNLSESYSPALLSHEDYPQLLKDGETVETLSASLVIAAFNWKRGSPQYLQTRKFVEALFATLQPGGEDDATMNLAATAPGWSRNIAAEDALKSRAGKLQASSP